MAHQKHNPPPDPTRRQIRPTAALWRTGRIMRRQLRRAANLWRTRATLRRRLRRTAAVWRTGRIMRRQRHLGYDLMLLRLLAGRDPETGDSWRWRDPGFARKPLRFAMQAGLATLAMLATLMFVQSLSYAAIAAGLASSVVGIFITPSNRTTRIRAVAGGHGVALTLGSLFSLILFYAPVETFLNNAEFLRTLSYAIAVGLAMLLMAVTNTEHPPAAGTAIGMASRQFDPFIFFSIIGAVIMLSILKLALRPYLQDLTD